MQPTYRGPNLKICSLFSSFTNKLAYAVLKICIYLKIEVKYDLDIFMSFSVTDISHMN
jgi:hypothetical protein